MRIGIDLGTTFCCVAYVDDRGWPRVIPSDAGELTTPSVVCFDGRRAVVGAGAQHECHGRASQLFQFMKRDTGKPPAEDPKAPDAPFAPYTVSGFPWGVVGIQALVLRALKRSAIAHLQSEGLLPHEASEIDAEVEAVITVPAYFGDMERMQTRHAAFCAGIKVVGIINEPTAAALAYGLAGVGTQRLLVVDLGGGTFDVTIIETRPDGATKVLASEGNRELGGKDLDDLILDYLRTSYFRQNSARVPDEYEPILRRIAVHAKHELSLYTSVDIDAERLDQSLRLPGVLRATLHRSAPERHSWSDAAGTASHTFHLEERATNFTTQIRSILLAVQQQARVAVSPEYSRPLEWGDLHQVVLVGGSSRLPLVRRVVEELTGRGVTSHPDGFDVDTAIAIGAALYGQNPEVVEDVAARGVGIMLGRQRGNRNVSYLEVFVPKNTRLPAHVERTLWAERNAVLHLYEGETEDLQIARLRGRLELGNPPADVRVALELDREGSLTATVSFAPVPGTPLETRTLQVVNAQFDQNLADLRAQVLAVDVNQ